MPQHSGDPTRDYTGVKVSDVPPQQRPPNPRSGFPEAPVGGHRQPLPVPLQGTVGKGPPRGALRKAGLPGPRLLFCGLRVPLPPRHKCKREKGPGDSFPVIVSITVFLPAASPAVS